MPTPHPLVEELRAVSRAMVRTLGFMGGDFAGTDLSPSAVHALIEIEQHGGTLTARDLGERLRLEKSSVSRMLRKLVASGEVRETTGAEDGRVKRLALTARGRRRVAGIHAFARAQVMRLSTSDRARIARCSRACASMPLRWHARATAHLRVPRNRRARGPR